MKKGLIILFIGTLCYSCKKNNSAPTPAPSEGHHSSLRAGAVLFESAYLNWAWGYSHSDLFIDTIGVVYVYTSTNSREDWNFPDSNTNISAGELQHDCNFTDSIGALDLTEVQSMHALVSGVTTNDVSPFTNTGNDMGGAGRYAYVWDNSVQKYHLLFLKQSGDFTQINNNPNAIAISNWLDDKFDHEIKDFLANYH